MNPRRFLEGNRDARVWIVGLNPAMDPEWIDDRTGEQLDGYFDAPDAVHSYFRDFRIVSRVLFDRLGKAGGTAHTDLVKCSSKSWPPAGVSRRDCDKIIRNCEGFLREQVLRFKPAMIVCNGADVSRSLARIFPLSGAAPAELITSYITTIEEHRLCVVLSGFIGRIDNYAKRRLGQEIEARMAEMGLD
jgi:uracil-DNA glycosylase